ncbi:MAG TPA: FAD-binding oxidoreductase [Acidimicrobiales bacterium]|nr:FAD-binding oxidoreductase [Acidimicrobiales bacterium]
MRRVLPDDASVVIVGGGVIGASAAFHLAEAGVHDVVLLEAHALGSGSSGKAAGGVRAQFSDRVNIELAQRSLAAFRRFPQRPGSDIDLRLVGYLFLLDDAATVRAFEQSVRLQNSLGVPSRMISVREAVQLAPIIEDAGLLAAAFSPTDGVCSPDSVVQGYAAAARRMGAHILTDCPVIGIDDAGDARLRVRTPGGAVVAEAVICAAGAWSRDVASWVGVDLPVQPVRREIAVTGPGCHLPDVLPMTIDFRTSFYFHREGPGLLMGISDPDEEPGFHLEPSDGWVERLVPAIAARAPKILDLGLKTRWAGLYEVTPDHNALIGTASVGGRFIYATGFSGHGFLMGPAVGEVLRDLYLGNSPSVDVTPLSVERFSLSGARPEFNVV